MDSVVSNVGFLMAVDYTMVLIKLINMTSVKSVKYFPVIDSNNVRIDLYLLLFGRIIQTVEVEHYIRENSFKSANNEHRDAFLKEYGDRPAESESLIVALGSVKKIPLYGWGGHCRFLVIGDFARSGE